MKVLCNSRGIYHAVKTLQKGGVVVFPTDTVYGIGCNPYNSKAVESIYKIKKRKKSQLFPVLGFSKKEISKIAIFDDMSHSIAKKFWPGQITLILKIKDEKIAQSMNLKDKIAVRVPKNQCVLKLLKECKLLIGTSANISGKKSIKNPNECIKKISGYDIIIDDGIIQSLGESTIVEISGNEIKILRKGCISKKEIMNIF